MPAALKGRRAYARISRRRLLYRRAVAMPGRLAQHREDYSEADEDSGHDDRLASMLVYDSTDGEDVLNFSAKSNAEKRTQAERRFGYRGRHVVAPESWGF